MGSLLKVCKERIKRHSGGKSKKAKPCSETSEQSEQRVDAPEPIPSDWLAIPLEACLFDPLYLGLAGLTGKVPDGWSRDGWRISLRDRMRRTDDKEMRRRLQDELDAVQPVVGER